MIEAMTALSIGLNIVALVGLARVAARERVTFRGLVREMMWTGDRADDVRALTERVDRLYRCTGNLVDQVDGNEAALRRVAAAAKVRDAVEEPRRSFTEAAASGDDAILRRWLERADAEDLPRA